MSKQKIGAGHLEAMVRLGLKELRNALNPSRESVADAEIGLYGTQTQGEIARVRGGPGQGSEQEAAEMTAQNDGKSSLAELRAQIQEPQRDVQQETERDLEREA